jgi:hypothetical protein
MTNGAVSLLSPIAGTTEMKARVGYRFDTKNIIKFYSQLFDGERHFSGTLNITK